MVACSAILTKLFPYREVHISGAMKVGFNGKTGSHHAGGHHAGSHHAGSHRASGLCSSKAGAASEVETYNVHGSGVCV